MSQGPEGPKVTDVMERVRRAAENGQWRLSPHAEERMVERDVVAPEVQNIMLNGWYKPSKDKWSDKWNSWRYAICGQVDDRNIRLAVTFDGVVWVVTVIDEDK